MLKKKTINVNGRKLQYYCNSRIHINSLLTSLNHKNQYFVKTTNVKKKLRFANSNQK